MTLGLERQVVLLFTITIYQLRRRLNTDLHYLGASKLLII